MDTDTLSINLDDINDKHLKENKVEKLLEKMRKNCVNLSIYHNRRYHHYKNTLFVCFRIPLIFLSGINSFIAVGTQNYINQNHISLINAVVSLFCGVITSVELLWNLQKRMEAELESYKNFYKLSIEILKYLELDDEDRDMAGKIFLNDKYSKYESHITSGNAVNVYSTGFLDELEYITNNDKEKLLLVLHHKWNIL